MLFFLIFKEFYNASQEDKCSKQAQPGKEALKDPVANQSTVRKNNLSEQKAGSKVGLVAYHIVTPHAQRERGKVIDCGVHIYIYINTMAECRSGRKCIAVK